MRMRWLRLLGVVGVLIVGLASYAAGSAHLLTPRSIAAADDCQTFPQTGKMTCGDFLRYWQEHGGLAQQGYPISDVVDEKSETDGITHKVQYFERAVFEAHPENQPPNTVLLSLLGSQKYQAKYASVAAPSTAPSVPTPTNTPVPASVTSPTTDLRFVAVNGTTPGRSASVTIQGPPSTNCTIAYTTPNGTASTAQGLAPKATTTGGIATWSWIIGTNTQPGTGSVAVQCGALSATTPIKIG